MLRLWNIGALAVTLLMAGSLALLAREQVEKKDEKQVEKKEAKEVEKKFGKKFNKQEDKDDDKEAKEDQTPKEFKFEGTLSAADPLSNV